MVLPRIKPKALVLARAQSASRAAQLDEMERLARMGSWEWDIATNSVTWSAGVYEIFGIDPATFSGTYADYMERVHSQDRGMVAAAIITALNGGGRFATVYRTEPVAGDYLWLHGRGDVVVDDDGRPLRVAGTVHDVTAIHRADHEMAIRASFERAVFTNLSDRILACDRDGLVTLFHPGRPDRFGTTAPSAAPSRVTASGAFARSDDDVSEYEEALMLRVLRASGCSTRIGSSAIRSVEKC